MPKAIQVRNVPASLHRELTPRARARGFLPRCFELRGVLSAYDAVYVALAEGLEADLLTSDRRLARTGTALGVACLPDGESRFHGDMSQKADFGDTFS
jgi:hypothetical protein